MRFSDTVMIRMEKCLKEALDAEFSKGVSITEIIRWGVFKWFSEHKDAKFNAKLQEQCTAAAHMNARRGPKLGSKHKKSTSPAKKVAKTEKPGKTDVKAAPKNEEPKAAKATPTLG